MWLHREYEETLRRYITGEEETSTEEMLEKLSKIYGEVTLPAKFSDTTWYYADQFGLFKKM